ncbi:hypothetical protein Bca4012_029734 [Brassica carinata]
MGSNNEFKRLTVISVLCAFRCKIGFTWTEKMVTNLGEVPLRSKKKRSHDCTPREIPVASTDEINTVSEEAGGVTAELGVAANANYCINQSDT